MCYILSGIGAGYKRARGKREQGVSLSSHKVMRPDNPRVTCDSPSRVRCRELRAAVRLRVRARPRPRACASAREKISAKPKDIYICVCTQYGFYTVRGTVSRIGTVTPLACELCQSVSSPAPAVYTSNIIFIVCLTHTRAHTVLPLRFTAENQIVGWHCSGAHVPRDTRSARRRRYAVKGNAGPSTQAGGDLCAEPSINPAQLVRGASLTQ